MPSSGHQPQTRKPLSSTGRKKRRKLRGPVLQFRLGVLILIWILSPILCFGLYMYQRNIHPEREDIFVSRSSAEPGSVSQAEPAGESSLPEDSGAEVSAPADESSAAEDDSSQVVIQAKINPVPESAPRSSDYFNGCAFLGDVNTYRFWEAGLLQKKNVYASEALTLDNYEKEYVVLEDETTIRILSMITGAQCRIYLMFGTESLAAGKKPDQVYDSFSTLLYSVKSRAPASDIFILSLPPVTAAAEKAKNPMTNSDVDAYNSKLLELAKEANVYFVDTNTALKSAVDGKLPAQYAEQDGIHLTAEAGRLMLDYILAHVPADLSVE